MGLFGKKDKDKEIEKKITMLNQNIKRHWDKN